MVEDEQFTHWWETPVPGVGFKCRIIRNTFLGYWIEAKDFNGKIFKTFVTKGSVFPN